jgi:hypothetical protein
MILNGSVSIDSKICLPAEKKPFPTATGIIAGWGQINSLIDFLNQHARIEVDQINLKEATKSEEKMFNSLVTLIPGSEAYFIKNLKVKKDIAAVKDNITKNYQEYLRQVQ